jgi:hypothetical protein
MAHVVNIERGKALQQERAARQLQDEAWRPTRFDDQLTFENGLFVWADTPDEFGPRAFQAVNLAWCDQWTTFLTDAATQWGFAPWALTEARACMSVHELGSWDVVQLSHQAAMQAVLPAIRKVPDCDYRCTALFLVRCALRLEGLCKPGAFEPFVAERCVNTEFALDARIHQAKKAQHRATYPDWQPPA